MSTSIEHEPIGEDLGADEYGEGHHGATDRQYIIIAVILAVITGGEVTLSYLDVGGAETLVRHVS